MLNRKPIFIVGFTRGGTNILLNILCSHPDVCVPTGETQEVFAGQTRSRIVRRILRVKLLPILLREGEDIFSMKRWEPRPVLSGKTEQYIDRRLFRDKLKARNPDQNMFKSENVLYTETEIAQSRIVCKNMNGLIFLSSAFSRMYPDATFFALVRNGFALCEGHIRRGQKASIIAHGFQAGCTQMLRDAQEIPNYHVLRYEDILNDPAGAVREVYQKAGLDATAVPNIRMQDKPVIDSDGRHRDRRGERAESRGERYSRELYWYRPEELSSLLRADVNDNQIARLKKADREIILSVCRPTLEHFGYI